MANSNEQLDRLENRISQLISQCQTLKDENARLAQEFAELDAQRTQLLARNEHASKQVREAVERLQQFSSSS